jgi:hypothetical protein
MDSKIGHWAFLSGVVLALIAGFVPQLQIPTTTWILVLLGLVVGFLNVTARETQEFLIACVAVLIAAGTASNIITLGFVVSTMLSNVVTFVFPAALIVAFKAIWEMASH